MSASLHFNSAADFPIFLRLAGERVLVVGGGVVALRKIRRLLRSGARVEVVARHLDTVVAALAAAHTLQHVAEAFDASQLDGCRYVVAATDDHALNARVAEAARRRNLFVNVVDDITLSTAISPAIVDRAPVTVAVSTSGTAPVLARRIKEDIEARLPAQTGKLARFLGTARGAVNARLAPAARRSVWEDFLDGEGAEAVLRGDATAAAAVLAARVAGGPQRGEVYLVGAGPGDPDLLTLRALRLMQQADVVFYDRLLDPRVLALVRQDAERVFVGKRSGHHAVPQAEINALLVARAQAGQRVLRLKGGDPFVFGRGGEEAEALAAHGVPFQLVPGVSAANGCAAYAGIPLTHRDYAQACVFVTGHARAGAELSLPWDSLARPGQTLVIYMGLSTLPTLCEKLVAAGLPPDWPAAVVENGTQPSQRVLCATLHDLPEKVAAAGVRSASLVIVGEVVKLRDRLAWFGGRDQSAEAALGAAARMPAHAVNEA
ncbi:MAG: uroporphyrinogen-III C-methyltransferase [Nevskiaceae bacterium]|nr:MAG: uroporphyrinogen-III C-methyltransferase [Nevskiaceae bacterium]TBR74425.1 MAG: uroporphyrinogen-III C-methyltransferase [Nevskiaceae bacterium]